MNTYHEFREPIPLRVIAGNGWPTGKALAYGFWRRHLDHHVLWHVCFDEGGEWWEIENPWVRGDPSTSWGRRLHEGSPVQK